MAEKTKRPGIDLEAGQIRYDYIKSNLFRVIYVQGIFGGITPKGNLQIALWNERWPIPKQSTYKFSSADGQISDEIMEERVVRDAVVREVEIQLLMDIDTAKVFSSWIQKHIADIEKATKGEAQ